MRNYFLTFFTAIGLLCSNFTLANHSNHNIQLAANRNHTTKMQLAPADIKRFVTTIGLIHHYYIKDIGNNTLFNDAISGMLTNLDPHSAFLDAKALKQLQTAVSGQFVGIGVELTVENRLLKVISPLAGSPAAKAGIKSGDIIIKINKQLVRNLSIDQAIGKIKGKRGTSVKLTLLRKNTGKPIVVTVKRNTIKILGVKSRLLENGYGYVQVSFFQGPVEKQMRTSINQLKRKGKLNGLILDLRNNPGGLLDVSTQLADDFLDAKQLKKYNDLIVYTKGRMPNSNLAIKATNGQLIPKVPMVVLINGGSASASEILAGALQDYHRAIIMGTQSFGKGSVQTVLPLSKNSAIKLTTALYYTPAGQVIQAHGITPDVVVPPLNVKDNNNSSKLTIDEADFAHHLKNNDTTAKTNQKNQKLDAKLAKQDYQLYQALMVLKAINALNKI